MDRGLKFSNRAILVGLRLMGRYTKLNLLRSINPNGRNIGKNPAPPSGRLFGHGVKIVKIF